MLRCFLAPRVGIGRDSSLVGHSARSGQRLAVPTGVGTWLRRFSPQRRQNCLPAPSSQQKYNSGSCIFVAPRVGIEPTTRGLHLTSRFPESVDYIFIRPSCPGEDAGRFDLTALGLLPCGIVSEPSLRSSCDVLALGC